MNRRTTIIVGVVALVVVAFVVAVVAGGSGDDGATDGTDAPAYGSPKVTAGDALPPLEDPANDPAVGRTAPTIEGTNFDDEAVLVGGRRQLVVFVAHWCPHCQAEVPRIVSWREDGELAEDVPIRTVATGTTPQRPNFPPAAWLEREHWPYPVLVDSEASTAARAYGLSAYPFFVALDDAGKVVARVSGEVTLPQLQALLRATGS